MENKATKEKIETLATTASHKIIAKSKLKSKSEAELDLFVKDRRSDALDYLKLLKDELTKTDQSRARHIYTSWILVAMFLLLNSNSAQLHFEFFEKIDQSILLKLLPAWIMISHSIVMGRMFILRERMAVFDDISARLFPSKYFPLSVYIKPSHLMLSEKLLNLSRPSVEILGNNLMLAVIVYTTVYGPAFASIYAYLIILKLFGIQDFLIQVSIVVGLICFVQGLVSLRGSYVSNDEAPKIKAGM